MALRAVCARYVLRLLCLLRAKKFNEELYETGGEGAAAYDLRFDGRFFRLRGGGGKGE